jgi:hypothetical protein
MRVPQGVTEAFEGSDGRLLGWNLGHQPLYPASHSPLPPVAGAGCVNARIPLSRLHRLWTPFPHSVSHRNVGSSSNHLSVSAAHCWLVSAVH